MSDNEPKAKLPSDPKPFAEEQLPKLCSDMTEYTDALYSSEVSAFVEKSYKNTCDAIQVQLTNLDETNALISSISATRDSLVGEDSPISRLKENVKILRILYSKIDVFEAAIKDYEAALEILEKRADEIQATMPEEGIKAKVGSLFSTFFSNAPTHKASEQKYLTEWDSEDVIPSKDTYFKTAPAIDM